MKLTFSPKSFTSWPLSQGAASTTRRWPLCGTSQDAQTITESRRRRGSAVHLNSRSRCESLIVAGAVAGPAISHPWPPLSGDLDPMLSAESRQACESGGSVLRGSHASAAAAVDEFLELPGGGAPGGHELCELRGNAIGKARPQKQETRGRTGDSGLAQRSQ